ncbi:MAG TPA: hypothetical protein VFX89_23180 [Gammaproteobacteria bacterium]|nr:hypothetical protein [Gammaproteobacteria bacterium]
MRPTLQLTVLAFLSGATLAFAGVPIKPTFDFTDMRLVVSYVSTGELVDMQREGGARPDYRDVRQSGRHGFSRLTRNRETGALTCAIFLPNDERPREVDDEATLTLGHELLHCMLGDYHR